MLYVKQEETNEIYVVADEKESAGLRSLGLSWSEAEGRWYLTPEAVSVMLEQCGFASCETVSEEEELDLRNGR